MQEFNYLRAAVLFGAGWSTVSSFVAMAVNDETNWTAVITLLCGWFVILVVALASMRVERKKWAIAQQAARIARELEDKVSPFVVVSLLWRCSKPAC